MLCTILISLNFLQKYMLDVAGKGGDLRGRGADSVQRSSIRARTRLRM